MSLLRSLLVAPLLLAALLLLSPVLLVVARTWRGRWFALGVLLPLGFAWLSRPAGPWAAALAPVPWLALFVIDGLRATRPGQPTRFLSLPLFGFTDPLNPSRVLPEGDLVRVAVALVNRLDPWMSRAEARTIRRVTARLLRDLDARPEWDVAPNGLIVAALALMTGRHRRMHRFQYTPELRSPDERLGVLAILHGHGPNARLWPFVWERFADEHRLTVAAPSFGYGAWEHPDGVGVVERCLYAVSFGPADMSRVYLAGISQGGAGVLRAAAAAPDRYAGLILLSPTIEPEVVESPAFRDGWRGRPVFVAHGGRDHNVTPESVAAGVAAMRAAGVDVTFHFDPDADHFLFFADLDGVHRRIGEWLRGTIPG